MTKESKLSRIVTLNKDNLKGLSYKPIYALRDAFRKSGTRHGDDFNKYDTPATLYFRPFFYFVNDKEIGGNLLDISWDYNRELTTVSSSVKDPKAEMQYLYDVETAFPFVNSAYNYLLTNCEYERAEYIKEFVQLLSNISTYSPWYFKQIDGLGEALKHTEFKDDDLEIPEERKKITFTMLADAYDQRVGTLLDLYRSACYSFTLNKEIVPANLRKFDMGILLFNTPIQNMHRYRTGNVEDGDGFAKFGLTKHQIDNIPGYFTNTKYIEFQNCEIEINSSGIDSVNNEEGVQPEYKIEISFDKCYETRYNEIIPQIITDIIEWDTKTKREGSSDVGVYGIDGTEDRSASLINETEMRSGMYASQEHLSENPGDFNPFDDQPAQKTINTGGALNNMVRGAENPGDFNPFDDQPAQKTINTGGALNNMVRGAVNQLASAVSNTVESFAESIVLGNLFDVTSLSKIGDTAQTLASGNVLGAANQIKNMAENGNGISVAGVGMRTSSGWIKKNIENPDNTQLKKTSKSYSLNPNQYVQMGKDELNRMIRTKRD